MKKKRIRKFPVILMLVAGSFTSIITYYFEYEFKAALLVLLSVLLIFYLLGLVLVIVIESFDQKNDDQLLDQISWIPSVTLGNHTLFPYWSYEDRVLAKIK